MANVDLIVMFFYCVLYIDQARKEIEAEKKVKESESARGTTATNTSSDHAQEPSQARVIDPESMAVSGVYFTCPLIGN